MKKLLAGILAITMLFALTACGQKDGGSADTTTTEAPKEEKQLYAGFYSATIPEGFETTKTQMEWTDTNDKHKLRKISIEVSSDSVDKQVESAIKANFGNPKKGDDVTIGSYTYKTVDYVANDAASKRLFAEMPGDSSKSIKVDLYMMTPDDEKAKTILESLQIEDDAYNKKNEFLKTLNN